MIGTEEPDGLVPRQEHLPGTSEDATRYAPWLNELPTRTQRRLLDASYSQHFESGDSLGKSGPSATAWIGVVQGVLKTQVHQETGKTVLLASLGQGSWVGEESIVGQNSRRYELIVVRPSRLLFIPAAVVLAVLHECFHFNRLIMRRISERLSQHAKVVEIDRMSDPAVRVARGIANLYNAVLHPLLGPDLPLSQKDIGDLTGLSRQSVGEALKKLEHRGALSIKYGHLVVRDLAALASAQKHHFQDRRRRDAMDEERANAHLVFPAVPSYARSAEHLHQF